jgi:hypothetical protein
MKSPLAFLSLLILPACFLGQTSINEPLDHRLVESIEPGATAAQVVAKMGAPDEVVQLGKRIAYRYSYQVDKGTGAYFLLLALYSEDTRSDRVWFFFDENQVLTHVGKTFRSHRASFGTGPSYDDATNQAADAERGLSK